MEVKLGTIGSGVIVHSVLDNVMKIDGIKLESVFSRSKEKAENLADEYKAQKIYTDFEKFLSDENVNTIYIATPNLLHYEQAKKSLLSGKNVICEKPFVTKSSQAHELKSIAREKNLICMPNQNRRFDADFLAVNNVKLQSVFKPLRFSFKRRKT